MGKKINNDNSKREMAVFKSLSYVVLSDTFCWIPIIIIGLLASGGVDISSDVYAWVIVLVLPINSALNPFIYTFSMIYRQEPPHHVYRIQTALSLGGEDPLDLQIPTPSSHTNSATSEAGYISVDLGMMEVPSKKVKACSYETKQWTSLAPMNVARIDMHIEKKTA
uniref:G-protein coupled receptors family 1 profile domain-containing protein n=1 Tax=Magallana gigas TaxID=29159 RepID=K1PQF8_MAGGI